MSVTGDLSAARDAIRARLDGRSGRVFWRSLDELAGTPAFKAFVEAEFPSLAPLASEIDRRGLLKAMAASLALAGLSGCSAETDEAALPYVNAPEFVVPGKPKWYATAVNFQGFAQPVLGKTHVGRPVKLEGNPDHPATGGATDAFMQAAILGLYDPDRSQTPRHLGEPASWDAFDTALVERAAEIDRTGGEGFRLLTGSLSSPTTIRQLREILRRWPGARWHVLDPIDDGSRLEASQLVFGRPLDQHLMLDRAELTISLDDDFLGAGPRQPTHGRRWSQRRLDQQAGRGDCLLFVAEPTPTLTGAAADNRFIAPSWRIGALTRAIASEIGLAGQPTPKLSPREAGWLRAAITALDAHRGSALFNVGAHYDAQVQALALLINEKLGSFGTTLRFTEPVRTQPSDGRRSFEILADDMAAGRVATLAAIGSNPVYTAPGELDFAKAMEQVEFRLHAGLYYDETASRSHWHAPLAHELESWSDARAVDGTLSIAQPLIRPFYPVRPLQTILAAFTGEGGSDRETVTRTWRADWGVNFERTWSDALVRGFVADTAFPYVEPRVVHRAVAIEEEPAPAHLTVAFRPDPTIWDGTFSQNAWLQETPKPFSKVVWGNVILVSPQLAAERHITNQDELRLEVNGRSLIGPAWIMPGQEANTVTVTFGYGRRQVGRIAEGESYDAFAIRSAARPWHDQAVLSLTGNRQSVATTQLHHALDGYDFVRIVDQRDLPLNRDIATDPEKSNPSFYPQQEWDSPSWGMSIDLDLCIGCNACVVACVAENNIPMVGKELVAEGREMHWLRVDHYHEGDPAEPKSYFQPVPCMHCEDAPCEMGCPVNAAAHSFDGLNLQIYNRCIGTRTCSSFCPYKVRHFNWFDYTSEDPEQIRAMRNPDVTVRSRGVMEKCTYCVQRISEARINAKIDGRPIHDGEVVTACQQACPTQAIIFGDVVDPGTAVCRRKADPRNYTLLEEANTRPRTTYLARIQRRGDSEGGGPA